MRKNYLEFCQTSHVPRKDHQSLFLHYLIVDCIETMNWENQLYLLYYVDRCVWCNAQYRLFVNPKFRSRTNVSKIRRNRRLLRQRAMEAMTGDSHIDRVSRVMFPLTFFLFNVVYWFAYLSHRQAEIVHNTGRFSKMSQPWLLINLAFLYWKFWNFLPKKWKKIAPIWVL